MWFPIHIFYMSFTDYGFIIFAVFALAVESEILGSLQDAPLTFTGLK